MANDFIYTDKTLELKCLVWSEEEMNSIDLDLEQIVSQKIDPLLTETALLLIGLWLFRRKA